MFISRGILFLSVVSACFIGGCSTVPSLEEASGTQNSGVLISHVVTRVRCEIADSFDDIIENPRYLWIANWTAKVDLTLQANNSGGVAPGLSYTHFYNNAFNFAAGSTSLTNKTIAAVNQTFTFGAGANLGEQAVRAEVVSFTLSLKELKRWRRRVAIYEAHHKGTRICIGEDGSGLTGNLGLKEWIASALHPVGPSDVFDLQAGSHPSPVNNLKPSSAPGAVKPGAPFAAGGEIEYDKALARLTNADDTAQTAAKGALASVKKIMGYAQQIKKAVAPNYAVLEPDLRHQIDSNLISLKLIATQANGAATIAKQKAEDVNTVYVLHRNTPTSTIPESDVLEAEGDKDIAVAQQAHAAELESQANQIASGLTRIDPPIDALLHSVQFVLSYGASVSPNWTLLQWKGPSPSGASTAALSGQRTHVLNIALGPVGNAEQNRLIQNQTVASPH